MRVVLVLLLMMGGMSASCADFDYSAYKPAQLSDISGSLQIDSRGGASFIDGHPRYHSQATFTGRIRPTDAGLRNYIRLWVKAMGHPPAYGEVFKRQVEIEQDAVRYWMPIQDVLVEPFKKEVIAGGRADLYLLLMGTYKRLPVFAVSEFDAIAEPSVDRDATRNDRA